MRLASFGLLGGVLAAVAGIHLAAIPEARAQNRGDAAPRRPAAAPGAPSGTASGAAPASRARELAVANETGLAVLALGLVPAGRAEPAEDLLGEDTLPDRATLRLPPDPDRPCRVDLRAVLRDGTALERPGLDLCRGGPSGSAPGSAPGGAPGGAVAVTLGDPALPRRVLRLANETDQAVVELFVFPAGAAERGPDRLQAGPLPAGEAATIRLGRRRECRFDLVAIAEDDTEESRRDLDLCRAPRLVLGDPAVPRREAVLRNAGPRPIARFHVAPPARSSDNRWGPDRLGGEGLEPGAQAAFVVRQRDCVLDLRAVYEDESVEERRGVDLCADPAPVFDGSGVPRPPERPVALVNGHPIAVEEAYLISSGAEDWGESRLAAPLARGARQEIRVSVGCLADLRIVLENGSAEERRGWNLCESAAITLRPGWTVTGPAPGLAGTEPPRPGTVRIRNAAPVPVVSLFVDPAGTPNEAPPGPDRLGEGILGLREAIDIAPAEPGACVAVLRAVFRDGRRLRLEGFDICAGTEFVLR